MRIVSAFVTGFLTILIVVATLLFAILAEPARANPQCDDLDRVLGLLAERYGEALAGQGIAGAGALMQLYLHPEGDTWTIVVVLPDGRACLMASGSDWSVETPPPAGKDT